MHKILLLACLIISGALHAAAHPDLDLRDPKNWLRDGADPLEEYVDALKAILKRTLPVYNHLLSINLKRQSL